jgi:positive regulator of sigma E activity
VEGGRGVQKYFLYALKSIQCVECGITEINLLLVAGNLLKYILLLLFFFGFETYRPIGR